MQEIGNILLNNKAITKEQLNFVLMIQRSYQPPEKLGRILRYFNFVEAKHIAQALAHQVGWKYFDQKYLVNLMAVDNLRLEYLMDRQCLPIETNKGTAVVLANPFDIETTDVLSKYTKQEIDYYVGSEDEISACLDRLDNRKKTEEIEKRISQLKEKGLTGDELTELADLLLDDAVRQGATDIHIEPEEKVSLIRFRIDGVLYPKTTLPKELHNNLVNVIFSRADINVSEFYKLHDARFEHNCSGRPVDVRVSCIPSVFGPALVLRLLYVNRTLISLEKLGFHQTHYKTIARAIQKPHGIVIVTGPTGSGKTTTLYAVLNQLKSTAEKIITIEDPIEIKMPLINQVQINEKQGVTFASAARAFLRHDPDIILIGEIRDSDTAKEAMRAAITGHRVFSTLHTNTAVDSVYRLHDLGIDLAHIANSILCVISQRLIRKLCPYCKRRVLIKKEEIPESFKDCFDTLDELKVYQAKGCEHCRDTGYFGRTVIAEVLVFSENIRDMVAQGNLDQLRHRDKEEGVLTLRQDAARLVLEGITSFEEAERVAG